MADEPQVQLNTIQVNQDDKAEVPVLAKKDDEEVAVVDLSGDVEPVVSVPVGVTSDALPPAIYGEESGDAEEEEAEPAVEANGSSENGSKVESPTENGEKNGVSAENGGEQKRKSVGDDVAELEVIPEKKAKLAGEEGAAVEGEVEAENGIPAN